MLNFLKRGDAGTLFRQIPIKAGFPGNQIDNALLEQRGQGGEGGDAAPGASPPSVFLDASRKFFLFSQSIFYIFFLHFLDISKTVLSVLHGGL